MTKIIDQQTGEVLHEGPDALVVLPVRQSDAPFGFGAVLGPDGFALPDTIVADDRGLSFSDIRLYMNGLIKRDCEAPSQEWLASPEGQAWQQERREHAARYSRGELRMVSLSESRKDGASIRYVEVDRAALRALIADGWRFGDDVVAWSKEPG